MRRTEPTGLWVVYRMTLRGEPHGGNVVCPQHEWDAMEVARPGQCLLVRGGIGTEQEAEKIARGTAGDNYRRSPGRKTPTPPTPTQPPVA